MADIDELDLNILRNLQENSRLTYSDLARILGVPSSTIRFKVNRLIKEGYIKKFVAILDQKKLGFPIVVIMLLRINPKYLDEIFEIISKMPEIHHMFQITGKYDLVCIFHVRNIEEVGRINNVLRGLEGVIDAETLLATGRLLIKTELPI